VSQLCVGGFQLFAVVLVGKRYGWCSGVGASGVCAELCPELIQGGRMARPTMCETRWADIISSFERNFEQLAASNPDCTEDIALLHTDLKTIGQLI
jgi:hypothetical protein